MPPSRTRHCPLQESLSRGFRIVGAGNAGFKTRRGNGPGAQRVTANAAVHVVNGHRPGKTDQCGLGGHVGQSIGRTGDARKNRSDVDDRTMPLLEHRRQKCPGHQKHTANVHIEGVL